MMGCLQVAVEGKQPGAPVDPVARPGLQFFLKGLKPHPLFSLCLLQGEELGWWRAD